MAGQQTTAILSAFGNTLANLRFLDREGLCRSKVPYLERQVARAQACLDWLNEHATPEGFIPGFLSIQDIALVCLWEWIERRGVIELPDRNILTDLIRFHVDRLSLLETKPSGAGSG